MSSSAHLRIPDEAGRVVLHDVLAQLLEESCEAPSPLDLLGVPEGPDMSEEDQDGQRVFTNDSLCSLITRLTQNMALSRCSPTKGPGFSSCTLRRARVSQVRVSKTGAKRTSVTQPSAGRPSATTVNWLLSLLALFFSRMSIAARSAVWVGPMMVAY